MTKLILNIISSFALIILLGSCNQEEENPSSGESMVTVKGSAHKDAGNPNNGRIMVGEFNVSHFQVGIQKFEMNYAVAADLRAGVDIGNIPLRSNMNSDLGSMILQPKTHMLIQEGNYQTTLIGEGLTPSGNYSKITFQLFKHQADPEDNFVHGKSLYILGGINGNLVRIWLTDEIHLEVSAEETNGLLINETSEILVRFNINLLLAHIDLSTANDNNNDGIIDIGPGNVDGNATIYTQIKTNLNSAVQFVH
ncbi:hypothetical protein [Anditalea andensis]|uniref:Lipoprotein n=1 Tax=Anditalea andensis TaxID=1048983 RepID=A0A074KTB6_9BACT|nr:hypothetical protein [Anditalea andensis]KEO73196.1 hypothetical protein EL17_12635 [Anditalea andensis]